MNAHLLLLLTERADPNAAPGADPDCHWRYASADGVTSGRGSDALVEQVLDALDDDAVSRLRVDAVLAGSAGYVCTVTPPPRSGRRLQQVLPFLVEEHVTGDIEGFHLVPDTRATRRTGALPVAVWPRAELQSAIRRIEALGISVDSLQPLATLLPADDDTLVIFSLPAEIDDAVYLAGPGGAIRADRDWWPLAAQGLLEDGQGIARTLVAGVSTTDPELAAITVALDAEVSEIDNAADACDWVADRARQGAGIELRTGELAGQKRNRGSVVARRWSVAALLAAWFAIEIALAFGRGLWYEQLAGERRAQAESLYRTLFPEENRVRNPRRQMEQHLQRAGVVAGPSDRVEFLDLLTPLAMRARQADWSSISYNRSRGELNAQLRVPTLAVLEAIKADLESAGLAAEIVNAVQENNQFDARLRVSAGSG